MGENCLYRKKFRPFNHNTGITPQTNEEYRDENLTRPGIPNPTGVPIRWGEKTNRGRWEGFPEGSQFFQNVDGGAKLYNAHVNQNTFDEPP